MRFYIHSIFNGGFWTALWHYFEWGWRLYDQGLQTSPIWSGTFGSPVLHHGYVGFIALYIGYLWFTKKDYQTFYMVYSTPTTWYHRLIMYLFSP